MPMTLGEAKNAALNLVRTGDYPGALHVYEHLLAHGPDDGQVRLHFGALLVKLGLHEQAVALYQAIGRQAVQTGHPLRAAFAAATLVALGVDATALLEALATNYGAGSLRLDRAAPAPLPVDPTTPVPEPSPAALGFDERLDAVVGRALALCTLEGVVARAAPPLPFLSSLAPRELFSVLRTLTVRRLADREVVFRQGDPGHSLHLLAAGELAVVIAAPDGLPREVARLRENAMFGEMALLGDQARTASVLAAGPADVLEVSREALAAVAAGSPALAEQLDRFARERLIKNLLATSPLFTPFSAEQQAELLQRFEGIEYDTGAVIIEQGQNGRGLFVLLSGAVEIWSRNEQGADVQIARLGGGELFGEMSLLTSQPTNATVRAVAPTTVLFLHRDYLWRLVAAIDELRVYFERLVETRAQQTFTRLTRTSMKAVAGPDDGPLL